LQLSEFIPFVVSLPFMSPAAPAGKEGSAFPVAAKIPKKKFAAPFPVISAEYPALLTLQHGPLCYRLPSLSLAQAPGFRLPDCENALGSFIICSMDFHLIIRNIREKI